MRDGMSMRVGTAIFLSVWYLVLIVSGGYSFLFEMILVQRIEHLDIINIFIMSMSAAAVASSTYYIRKLYKDLFLHGNDFIRDELLTPKEIATALYYISRPVFGVLFGAITVLAGLIVVHAAIVPPVNYSHGFLYLSTLVSIYGSVVTGQMVRRVERVALDRVRSFGVST